MRARNLKPGLFKNEMLGSADPLITILFAGLWCSADREGRLEDRPLRLCAEVFPYRRKVTEKQVGKWLDWLHDHKFIARYVVSGQPYIQVLEFLSHQNPHKDERPSKIPPLSSVSHSAGTGEAPCDLDKSPEVVRLNPSSLNPESGILNPESSLRDARARAGSRARGHEHDPDGAHAVSLRVQEHYPAGTYRGSNWILAEREISKLLNAGEDPEHLVASARDYRAQQNAKGSTGTQYVLSPEKFFGTDGHWRGPFPIPKTPAEAQRDTTRDELLRRITPRTGTEP